MKGKLDCMIPFWSEIRTFRIVKGHVNTFENCFFFVLTFIGFEG